MNTDKIRSQITWSVSLLSFVVWYLLILWILSLFGLRIQPDGLAEVFIWLLCGILAYLVSIVVGFVLRRPGVDRLLFMDVREWKLPRL